MITDIHFLNLEIIPIAFSKGGEPFKQMQEAMLNAIEKERTHQTLRKIAKEGLHKLAEHEDIKISSRAQTFIEEYKL